jgi:hypothetical protein
VSDRLLPVPAAAERLGLHPKAVRALVHAKAIPAVEQIVYGHGKRPRQFIRESDLANYIASLKPVACERVETVRRSAPRPGASVRAAKRFV